MQEKEPPTVADIFRRAQALRRENPEMKLKDLRARLVREFRGGPLPDMSRLAIPEQDARAPEEDWSAGLSLVRRGIQNEDWADVARGIAMSLDQTERYERERGTMGGADDWHDRSTRIRGQLEKGVGKWIPEELLRLAEKQSRNK